ncbi:MAG: SRPBCC family protein [Saprospiraceae bacterium]|nr:SRPBCC family protein [Saprospiraceae bacterium]
MKALKYFLIVIGILLLITVILGLAGPKSYDVHRSAVVRGTPQQVWPYVSSLKNMALWSPWAEKDTVMVVEYTGTDGTVGSTSSWSGNKHVGKGVQTITKLEPTTYSETELKFMEPMENTATGFLTLKDTIGGTFVTWGIKGENGFVGRIFGSVMNMDKMMAPDFERGLSKLAALVASSPKMETGALQVMPGEYPGGKYLGIRGSMTFDKIPAFYEKSYGNIFPALEKAGGKPTGMPCGLYYNWDTEKMTSDLAAAVACTGDFKSPAGMDVINLPAAKSLTIDYLGGYNSVGKAHEIMDAYMRDNKLKQLTPVIEEYVTDPGTEPDSNKWLTKVTYFLK